MKPIHLSAILFLLVLCVFEQRLSYSQTYRFENFSSDDGYTGVGFPTFAQDSLGFLWIKAANGLYRYDGYGFKVYHHDPMDSLWTHFNDWGLPTIDPSGNLWIHDSRLRIFNRDLDDFITYSPRYSPGGGIVTTFFEKDKETIWLGMWSQGLVSLNLKTNKTVEYSNNENPIGTIVDRGPYFLLFTQRGLWKFDKESKKFLWPKCSKADSLVFAKTIPRVFVSEDHYWMHVIEPLHHSLVKVDTNFVVLKTLDLSNSFKKFDYSNSYPEVVIESIDRDQNGIFWIASQGLGLFRIDPADNKIDNIRNDPYDAYSLPSDQLVSVMVDRDQNVWVASTDKGISQLKKQSLYFYNYLRGSTVSSAGFLPAGKAGYLIAATEGKGIWTSSISTNSLASIDFQYFGTKPNVVGFENLQTMHVGESMVWFGSMTEGVMGLPINMQTGMMEHGPPLILQHGPDPNKYYPNAITSDRVLSLYEDATNNLWIGTAMSSLNKVVLSLPYGENGSVVHFRHEEGDSTSIGQSPYIFGFYPENDFSFWIGITPGLELYNNGRFEHVNKKIHSYFVSKARDGTILLGSNGLYEGRKEGAHYRFVKVELLGNSLVNSVEEDRLGRLWVATLDGLFCYNRTEKTILHFKETDGLASSRSRVMQMPDGRMAVSTPNGISLFDPMSLDISRTKLKPVLLLLKVNNKPVGPKSKGNGVGDFFLPHDISGLQELVFDYQHNIFSLEFAALELTAPEKNLYAYKLEGFNNEWVYTDAKNRVATYTNLDPGHYTFKVRASSRDGVWNDHDTTLKIQVLPPPWRTWWAYCGYSLLGIGLLFVARRNIVQRERLKANLTVAKVEQEKEHFELEKAKEVDQLKSQFFANISHEFRTPITLVLGPLKDFQKKLTDPEQKNVIGSVIRNGQRLQRLINQLLDLSKVEAGKMKLLASHVDLVLLLREITSSYESLAKEKNIRYFFNPEVNELMVYVDEEKIEKIVHNILSNAFKFTKQDGQIILNLKVQEKSAAIAVTDSGIGIPEDQLDKIFDRFYQVDNSRTRSYEGTGLGLALVKDLVELHHGKISVDSTEGKGTTFTISLPLGKEHLQKEEIVERRAFERTEVLSGDYVSSNGGNGTEKESAKEKETPLENPMVLVVEDNSDMRQYIRKTLSSHYQIIEAENGRIGVRKAEEAMPDMIISDIMMPEMDGYKFCSLIKSKELTSHIPVILLTAKADRESKLSGLEIGADDYLSKPFDAEELKLIVRNRIEERRKMREHFSREITLEPKQIPITSLDEKFITKVLSMIESHMEDEEFSIEDFSQEAGCSRMQFYRKIKGLTDQTPSQFVRSIRLKRAAQLLLAKSDNVSQIAYSVGFSSLAYFNKCFKEQFGITPGQYAEANKTRVQ